MVPFTSDVKNKIDERREKMRAVREMRRTFAPCFRMSGPFVAPLRTHVVLSFFHQTTFVLMAAPVTIKIKNGTIKVAGK
jgi:hypothetical protein